ncbi:hypothetical protein A1O7_01449 [Cladophialophora yegresii CBS 114405]|uniref:Uncharacterized protein n=1 Tax=Cladophialophora yegresii CBS 114405 TaxID=1182544 RepID=W9X3P3_9EURO|nr:uncharacterized protein A1O7_01449 [Cladophialophora yegresii CBS 114405]EXJ65109.1 hypothetical protein A1O7_01449 [Cladophialophora yegresii CBS 114405]
MTKYRKLLLNGGELMHHTVLDTEKTLGLILDHFVQAEHQTRRISSSSRLWSWHRTREVDRMLQGLLERLKTRLDDLVKSVDAMEDLYFAISNQNWEYIRQLAVAQAHVVQQIRDRGMLDVFRYWQRDGPLDKMVQLLDPLHFPLEEIRIRLAESRFTLRDSRTRVRLAREEIDRMANSGKPGPWPKMTSVMRRLQQIIEQLESTKANMESQWDRATS